MVVTPRDVDLLSKLLVESFSNVVFVEPIGAFDIDRKPSGKLYASINDCPSEYVDIYLAPDGWSPEYAWCKGMGSPYEKWRLLNVPLPVFWFQGHTQIVTRSYYCDNEPPHFRASSFLMSYNAEDAEHQKIKRKMNRVLDAFASNKTKYVDVSSLREIRSGTRLWAGPDAIRWCREDSTRFLAFDCFSDGTRRGWLPAE